MHCTLDKDEDATSPPAQERSHSTLRRPNPFLVHIIYVICLLQTNQDSYIKLESIKEKNVIKYALSFYLTITTISFFTLSYYSLFMSKSFL